MLHSHAAIMYYAAFSVINDESIINIPKASSSAISSIFQDPDTHSQITHVILLDYWNTGWN